MVICACACVQFYVLLYILCVHAPDVALKHNALMPYSARAWYGSDDDDQLAKRRADSRHSLGEYAIAANDTWLKWRQERAIRRVCHAARRERRTFVVGVALPIVSSSINDNAISERERFGLERRDAQGVLVLQAIMRTLAETAVPSPHCVKTIVYLGIGRNDTRLLANLDWLLHEALTRFVDDPTRLMMEYRVVLYPGGGAGGMSLSEMYNTLGNRAYRDGADYIISLNDDMEVFGAWRELLIDCLIYPPSGVPRNLGAALVQEISQDYECPPYPLVSRLHFDLFGKLWDDLFISYGIDLMLCDTYRPLGALHIVPYYLQRNHLVIGNVSADGKRVQLDWRGAWGKYNVRYQVDPSWSPHDHVKRVSIAKWILHQFMVYYNETGRSDGFTCTERRPMPDFRTFARMATINPADFFLCSQALATFSAPTNVSAPPPDRF